MADPLSPPAQDPFAGIDPAMKPDDVKPVAAANPAAANPVPGANDNAEPAAGPANPFADLGPEAGPGESGKVGSFARGAEKGALPAAASLVGVGAGATLGEVAGPFVGGAVGGTLGYEIGKTLGHPYAGAAVGAAGGVVAGVLGGGIVGGLAGGYGGSVGGSMVQNWAVNKVPESWKDALGFGDRQARLDENQHSSLSFMGGLFPYAVTMRPSLEFRRAGAKALPEGATLLQHILASPAAAKLFGGALMGGMEVGNEELSDKKISWPKVAIATVFGTVFSKPNDIGDVITEMGAWPTRTILGVPHPVPAPTLAQAADLKVMGPGITESVFHGTQEQAPAAALTAQENARVEQSALGEPPEPDLHAIARQMEPETFARYDELLKRRETLSDRRSTTGAPETMDGHLLRTNAEIEAMEPDIAAAYRRARDTVGTGQVEAEPFKSFAEMLAARESDRGPAPAPTLDARLDAMGAEAGKLATESFGGKENAKVPDDALPLHRALSAASSVGWDVEKAAESVKWANENGRPDIAQAIAERAEARAARPADLPGVSPESPRYETIKDNLQAIKEQDKKDAIRIREIAGKSGVPSGGEAPNPVNGAGPTGGAGVPVPQRTIGEQRSFIAGDVTQKLIAAGRPKEEAEAAGQLLAARFVTRAGRFQGKLGTPEQLYAREGAAIAGPTGRAEAPAQPPTVADYLAAGAAKPETPLPEAAKTPATQPGILANDFDTADRIKNEWRATAPFKDTETFIGASKPNQEAMVTVGDQIAKDLGITFKNPGIKAKSSEDIAAIADEAKRKKAEKGRARLETKAKRTGIGGVTDQVRSGFEVQSPEQADQAIATLGQHFQVVDEGWQTVPGGYFDRKAYVRFADGMIGEVQFWAPGMFEAKKGQGRGHILYEGVRELPPWHPLIPQFHERSAQLYGDVRAALSPEWKAVLGNDGNLPNRLPNASGDSTVPFMPTSAALSSDHVSPESTQASEGVQKNGLPSNEPAFSFGMGSPADNIGPHTEPVNAALDIADKVNALSPAEQKREVPKYSPAAEITPKGVDQPAGVFMFDPTQLNVDAQRFQFKSGGDEYGVTGALRNVTKWDPAKAQAIIVWEQNDGKLYVADGHQRAGLARRLTEKNNAKNIELPGILYREKDGISADDIRAMAAVTNIANGSGSALDGAKVLRARPDLMDGSLPLSTGKGKQAAALARLGDEPFRMVLNDVIPEHYGSIVGELIPHDPARQEAAIKAIARFEPKNADEAAVLTQRVAQAELARREAGSQASMFGDLETAESTAGEEMKIVGRAIADLKKDKALFGRVLANAERIEATGSSIERDAAQSVASDSELFAKTLTSDAYTQGPIRNELIKAARDLKNGKANVAESSARIIAALRAQVEAHGLDRPRAVEPGAGAEPSLELAQDQEGFFEPGAEGKPQALIPGVAPVTQRELIQQAANKPLTAKKPQRPMDAGLFGDSMHQKELFQRDPGVVWHGSISGDLRGGASGLHVGTYKAAKQALEARIGIPASGEWDGTREYGKTLLAGKETLKRLDPRGYNVTGYNVDAPEHDYYPTKTLKYPDGSAVPMDLKPAIRSFKITGGMTNTPSSPHEDFRANGYMTAALKRGNAKNGYYYKNVGEDAGSISAVVPNGSHLEPISQKELHQQAQGGIKLNPRNEPGRDYLGVSDINPILRLMKRANASTMIHESGHQFLAELMRDAQHPDAPADLKADAKTALDWLGAKSADDLTTRHHEKFARGFEQYLREGVAPSRELAGVFAKFRNWLLSIYQSIKGLGTEISPEIRSVFDRLLEMEPQRTILTPHERAPGGPLLHEIHTADAAHTEPHEAAAVFDRTKAEFDRYVTEPPLEIAHEITPVAEKIEAERAASQQGGSEPGESGPGGTESGPEAGAGPGGPGEVVERSGGSQSVPQSGSVGQGRGDLGGSAGQPAAESDGVQRADNRAKLGDHPGTALAPGPADLFGPRDSGLVDKAGNIRLDNLTSDENVARAIRESAASNNDFIGDRRGVITDGQVLELADALGMDAQTLNQRQLGQAFNAEQIVAARKLLIQSAGEVSLAMKKASTGTDEDVMAYAAAKARHQGIQAQVAGITAEAGRALRAFRDISGEGRQAREIGQFIREATGKTLFQLRAEARLGAELQTPQQVSKFMADSTKHNFSRILLEYWINGLISGPATHITYMAGNTISAIMKVPESIVSAAVSRAATALGREGTGVHGGEAIALIHGFGKGFAPALKAGIEAARTGVTTALPGEGPSQTSLPFQPGSELAQPAHLDEAATFHDAMSAAYGLVQGMKDTVVSTAALVAAGGVPGESLIGREFVPGRATPNLTYRGVTVLPTGALATLPGRGVAVIHSFFRSLVFSMEKNAIAYRQAANEGLAGTELHARVAQLRTDPSQATMNEAASHEATEVALMGKGSELTQRLSALTNTPIFGAPLLKFIDPFVRVSGNIIDQSLIRRTPVGLLTLLGPETELARDLTGKNGNVAQDKAIGRMMVGTALAVTFGSLAAQKMLSGSGPKDPKEARVWVMAGNQPHSIRIGDTWYQVNKLGPMGMLASISADLYDVAHEAEQGDFTKAGAHLLHAITQNVLDESAMHGPAEMLKAIESPDRYGEAYVRNYLAAFVPYSVGLSQIGRAADPYQRDTRTMIDTIRNKIPGHLDSYFGNELPVRRDIWGEPLPSRSALGGAGVSAIYEQQVNNDPVNQAMWKIGVFPGSVPRKIRNAELTADQYDDFQRIAGRAAKMRLDKMVISPQFLAQTPSVQHDWMTETIKQSRSMAVDVMLHKYPVIAAEATAAKQSKKQAVNDRDVE